MTFYDWEENYTIACLDGVPTSVHWSDSGETVAVCCEGSYFVLRYNAEAVQTAFANNASTTDGVEDAFEITVEISETVVTACWVGETFIYTNSIGRLQHLVGSEVMTIAHMERQMFLLGYIPKENRLFLIDKEHSIVSYQLLLSVVEYQTAILRGDMDTAQEVLPNVPESQFDRLARFLEAQDLKEEALELVTDLDHKFELAMGLGKHDMAHQIAQQSDQEHKWETLGDAALSNNQFRMAEQCMTESHDLSGLLLLHTARGNSAGMDALAGMAQKDNRFNVAFMSLFLTGKLEVHS